MRYDDLVIMCLLRQAALAAPQRHAIKRKRRGKGDGERRGLRRRRSRMQAKPEAAMRSGQEKVKAKRLLQ